MNLKNGIFILCTLVSSCKTSEKVVKEVIEEEDYPTYIQGAKALTPVTYLQYEKDCTPEKALKDIGYAPIWIEGVHGKEKVIFNFSGISGNGLVNPYSFGVVHSYVSEEHYDGCIVRDKERSSFECSRQTQAKVQDGSPVLICQIPSEGYPMKSRENAALVALAAFLKTMRNYELVSSDKISKKIGILLFPEFRRVLRLPDGSTETRIDVDNARWTNRKRSGGWEYTIELLPTSTSRLSENPNLKEMWLQMGVISHETGHHIFAGLVGDLKEAGYKNSVEEGSNEPSFASYFEEQAKGVSSYSRIFGIQTVVSALDECFADFVSYLSFSGGQNPYYTFELDRTKSSRKVNASRITGHALNVSEEKALTQSFLKHFFSHKRTFPPANGYTPDHQDEHAMGAVIANSFDLLLEKKHSGLSKDRQNEEKYKFFIQWAKDLHRIHSGNASEYKTIPSGGYSKNASTYNSGPALFLEKVLWEGVKSSFVGPDTLTKEQCEILERKFPVYSIKWKSKYKCK